MSLRYTGEATMDEPALRDVERWKDKIEVRLDNRQVFFLFFGSAMVACMLFVLGVIVGKRLESRGRAEAPLVEDPLAVLDRFGAVAIPAAPPAALTFPRALIGGGPSKNRPSSPERLERTERADKVERVERATAERVAAEGGVVTKPILTAAAPLPLAEAPAPAPAVAPRPSTVPAAPAKVTTAARKLSALPRPLAVASASSGTKQAVTAPRELEPSPKVAAAAVGPKAAGGAVPSSSNKPKARFLLQLSSFQERGEAEAFARRFAAQNAYVVATELPGKGTWYRVRVGSYGSMQEAAVAKTNFERDHNVIAYVAGNGPAK